MKKRILCLMMLALAFMLPVAASAFTINDVVSSPPYTAAEVWRSGQPVGGGYAGTGVFQDVIGNQFATDSMIITFNPFTVVINTNNQPGGWVAAGKNWGVADLAINDTSATASYDNYTLLHFPAAVSQFELGVDMQAYAAGIPQSAGNGVAWLANNITWETSFANANPIPGLNYGGGYKASNAPAGTEVSPVEVRMQDANRYAQGIISWIVTDPTFNLTNGIPDYQITVTFPNIPGAPAEFLWGTALCGNDIVNTPIPGSLLLLGSGIVGLVGIGLRRKEIV